METRRHSTSSISLLDAPRSKKDGEEVTSKNPPRDRNREARQFFNAWRADSSGYDEATWPLLRDALEKGRTPHQRRLFDGGGH